MKKVIGASAPAEESFRKGKAVPEQRATPQGVRLSWPLLAFQALLHLAPWVLVAVLLRPLLPDYSATGEPAGVLDVGAIPSIDAATPSDRVMLGRDGPWGQLQYTLVGLEMPSEFVFLDLDQQDEVQWHFGGFSDDQVEELFRSAKLPPATLERLLDRQYWQIEPGSIRVAPSDEVILSLSPESRTAIYSVLVRFPENEAQRKAYSIKAVYLDRRIEFSALDSSSADLFRRLLYPQGELLLFADMLPALRTLPTDEERIHFVKTVARKGTVLAKLRITPETDVAAVVEYWGAGGRAKDLLAFLESLQRVPGGFELDVTHLLPAFARRRVYTFPTVTGDPTLAYQDCHWTAMNFFKDPPDDRFADLQYVSQTIAADYFQISSPSRFGDLIFLADDEGNVHHSAVFLADDLVFTKNGVSFTEPWTLMRMDEMVEVYNATRPTTDGLKLMFYRNESL